jgi:hypothetical protein
MAINPPKEMTKFLKVFLILLPLVCGCQKLPDEWITLSESEFEAPYDGGDLSVSIESHVEWRATVKYFSDRQDWITLTDVSGGKGKLELVIRVADNPSRTREAMIYITPSDPAQLKCIAVKQVGTLDRDITSEFGWTVVAAFDPNTGPMTYENVMNRKSLAFENITPDADFRGLELFKNLTGITVRNSKVQSLGFSQVPWLKTLYFQDCELGALDLSGNTALEDLRFKETVIPFLDTSDNPGLSMVDFSHTETPSGLKRVILGPGVECFGISNTKTLEEIDCTRAVKLNILYFPNCKVRRLDLSNTQIEYLEIESNPIDELLLPPCIQSVTLNGCNGSISSLSVGAKTRYISIFGTQLRELDIAGAEGLWYLYCCNNLLPRLDLSRAKLPEYLNFGANPGVDGVFELIVSPEDFEEAKERFEGLVWDMGDYVPIVAKVVEAD